jgi:hypothetical protein
MQSEKYRRLVDRLIAKTDQHELDWREGVVPGSFLVSFPHYSLRLEEKEGPSEFTIPPPDIMMSIINMSGDIIDTVYQFEIDGDTKPDKRTYYVKMRDLYRMVRQQVLGADKAVEEILSELGE